MRKSWFHTFAKPLGVVLLLSVLTLAGCGGGGSGKPGSGVNVTIGSKKDADGRLLAEMYTLLLQQQGYNVTTKLGLGDTPFLDSAIKSGAVDIYPEFTGTAQSTYKLKPSQDAHQAYTTVKDYYEQTLHLTWLDAAFGLNDSYAICTSQGNATKFNLKSVGDLTAQNGKLNIASQSDGIDAAINPVQQGYGVTFAKVTKIDEQLSFDAVKKGDVDLMVCYTTDPAIVTNSFVVLTDPKGVFPNYNPAPVVRDQLLSKSPSIKDFLNPLAAKLTTADQVDLIKQVSVDNKTVQDVAKAYLVKQGLLPA
ncbi:MAG TPA: glycine betaine ABC transporter substrate-binding protein [Ktedonobacterales bacterium]